MSQVHMDLRVDFGDDEFDFMERSGSRAPSVGTISTAPSACDPFTPTQSGRSSPHQHITFDPVSSIGSMSYDMTPPGSALGGHFPVDVKAEFQPPLGCHSIPSPHRNPGLPSASGNMDFDYNNMFGSTLSSHGHTIESANPHALHHYHFSEPFTNEATSSSFFSAEGLTCDPSAWPLQGDGSVCFLDKYHDSAVAPMRQMSIHDKNAMPHAILASNDRRRLHMNQAQQSTNVLHRVQARQHNRAQMKRERSSSEMLGPDIKMASKGNFKCDYPECVNHRAFKRSEHLKRHKTTCHNPNPELNSVECEFCKKIFNRRDNWRQHLLLHTQCGRASARTTFFAGAKAVYDAEMRRTKQRNGAKKKLALKNESGTS